MRAVGASLLVSMIAIACGDGSTSDPIPEPDDSSSPPTTTETDATEPTNTAESSKPKAKAPPKSKPSSPVATPAASVNLHWNALGNFMYSLDVKTPEGTWVSPCIDVSVLGSATSVTYKGLCTSTGGKAVPNPAAYRLYFTRSNVEVEHWQDFVEIAPTKNATDVAIELPTSAPSSVALNWNAKPNARYSLDVFLMNGEQIRPCVNANGIGNSTSISFDGNCTSGPSAHRVDLKDIKDFVLCSTVDDNWKTATCTGIPYTGYGTSRTIPN